MVYIKKCYGNDLEVNIDVYENEFYSKCPKCGKEIQLSTEVLIDILKNHDLVGTSVYCNECLNHVHESTTLKLIKSQSNTRNVLSNLINQVENELLKKELFNALDVYDQLVFNDLDNI